MLTSFAQSVRRTIRRPLRSILTVLEVALGVLAVTVAFHAVQARGRAALPADVFYVVAGEQGAGNYWYGLFRIDDLPKLQKLTSGVESLEIYAENGGTSLEVNTQRFRVAGSASVGANFANIMRPQLLAGSFFNSKDTNAVLISDEVAKFVLPGQDLIGQTIRMGSSFSPDVPPTLQPHKIVGVFKHDPSRTPAILQPFTSTTGLNAGFAGRLIVKAKPGKLEAAQSSLLAAIRKLYSSPDVQGSGAFGNFKGAVFSTTQPDLSPKPLTGLDPQSLTFTAFAIVMLVTSVIGVFSIQLVDVIERTRELSMRRVLGATRTRVMLELMLDGLLLSGLGALIGVIAAAFVFPALQSTSGPFVFTRGLVFEPLLALGVLAVVVMVVTVLSSYPALLASRLKPVEALREM
jgi:hypothetical protein